jgi:hypothetical protein
LVLGNGGHGVHIGSASGNFIGVSGSGIANQYAANEIAGNDRNGVRISGTDTTGICDL